MRNVTLIFLWALLSGLAGCSEYRQRTPELTFAHLPPIVLDVREAQIDSRYRSPGTPPHIEQTVKPTPEAALIRWRSSACARRHAEHRPLHHFERTADRREPAQELRLGGCVDDRTGTALDGNGRGATGDPRRVGSSAGRLYREGHPRTDLPEGLTEDQRDRFWYDLSATMAEFDAEMMTGIRQYAAQWMR